MEITDDDWLKNAIRKPLPGGAPMKTRRFLIIHFTAGMSAESSIEWWRKPAAKGASAHIVIDRDGTVYQCRPFDLTCGHAGVSEWRDPKTKKLYTGLNSCSIGIELANAGSEIQGGKAFGRYECPAGVLEKTRHKNGGPVQDWERYPEAQMRACVEVSRALVAQYNLDDVVGHDDIAPRRKPDPGPAFDMGALRTACGFPAKIG